MTEPASQETTSSRSPAASRRGMPRRGVLVLVLMAAACAGWLIFRSRSEQFPAGITEAQTAQARAVFAERFGISPDHADTLAMLGDQLRAQGELTLSAACYAAIPETHPRFGLKAQLQLGVVLAEAHRAAEAEAALRAWLQRTVGTRHGSIDDQLVARQWLTYLLSIQLRLEERHAIHAQSHAEGLASLNDSRQYYFPHLLLYRTARGAARLRQYLAMDPQNLQLQIAQARYLTGEGLLAEAEQLLRNLHEQPEPNRAVAAALLECLYEQNDWQQFAAVMAQVPAYEDGEPWLLTEMRGRFNLHEERWEDARREFQHVLDAEPAHSACQMGLIIALRHTGRTTDLAAAEQRALALAKIRVSLPRIRTGQAEELEALASLCDEAGLSKAAARFRQYAQQNQQRPAGLLPAQEVE